MDRHPRKEGEEAQSAAEAAEAAAPAADPRADRRWLAETLPLSLDAYEKAALERALYASWGDAAEAARLLGIGRSTFYRKAGKHGIHLDGARGQDGAPGRPTTADAPGPGVSAPKSLG